MENIHIRLIEVVETYIACPAKKIYETSFEIISNEALDMEDAISIWEFFPGDVVKCDNYNGNWFAKKLVSSTFPDRKIYQLIFLIVESSGEISIEELNDYGTEIKQLVLRSDIVQKGHPAIQAWLEKNNSKVLSI